jgi:Tfp pilus assembly protein PilO
MTTVDYYQQYVDLMSEKIQREKEALELKKKLQDQAEEVLNLHKLIREKDQIIQELRDSSIIH